MSNDELNKKELTDDELNDAAGGKKERITCPNCGQPITVNLEKKNVKCPKCGKEL